MLRFFGLVIPSLVSPPVQVATTSLLSCPVSYIDGGLYMGLTSEPGYRTVTYTIPSSFSYKEKFQLRLATNPTSGDCCGPLSPLLLAKDGGGFGSYTRLPLTPYIDTSPGAFAPIRFTADNSTLKPGETTYGWMSVYGFLMWSPTGYLKDVYPPPQDGAQTVKPEQGWQLVPTSNPDVVQVYWNQTLFESNTTNADSWSLGQCRSAAGSLSFDDSL